MSIELSLSKAAELLNCSNPTRTEVMIQGAQIDSRKIAQGDLFVAIDGERVDGHDYITQAREAGACAALVTRPQSDPIPQLVVTDIVQAFGLLAQYWQRQSDCKTIAVTGSNGKTTVKEILASMLKQSHQIISTEGNLNNHFGVPLTLFRLKKETDFAVIEMGANHRGEIAYLVDIAEPDIAIISNVSVAHLAGFGSLQGIAEAKGEIFAKLPRDGAAILNADSPYLDYWKSLLPPIEMITFGLEAQAEVVAEDCQVDEMTSRFKVKLENVEHDFELPLPGRHNIANALAAISVCKALGIESKDMINGLAVTRSTEHRLQFRAGINGATLIDDSYNANPSSYQQALATIQAQPGEHWLVLGDFAELGSDSEAIHYQLGQQASEAGVIRLFTLGTLSQQAQQSFQGTGLHFSKLDDLADYLEAELTNGVICLIKGSRFMQLDRLANRLASEGIE